MLRPSISRRRDAGRGGHSGASMLTTSPVRPDRASSARPRSSSWASSEPICRVCGGITSARCLSRSCRVQAGCRSETRIRALASAWACASREGGAPGSGPSACGCVSASGPRAFDTEGAMPASSPPSVASHRTASACQSTGPVSLPWRDSRVASAAMCRSSREVGARPCLCSQARASSRSFSWTWTVRVEYASICACVTPRISLPRPSARGIHSTPNSAVSSHSTLVAATACSAPRTARRLTVSRARHLPSLKVRVIRAIWLWM